MRSCVVIQLGGDARTVVRRLWSDLERCWSLHRAHGSTAPHLTLAVLHGDVDSASVRAVLAPIAGRTPASRATGAGFGVFVGHGHASPVLHLGVTRTPALSALHDAVVTGLAGIGVGVEGEYDLDHWRPHITLADGDLTPAVAGDIMESLLATGPRHWTVTVDNVALIDAAGNTAFQLPLRGGS